MHDHRHEWLRRGAWVLVSAFFGAGLGVVLTERNVPDHRFLTDAVALARGSGTSPSRSGNQVSRQAYILPGSANSVASRIRGELLYAIEQSNSAKEPLLFVVPRKEHERTRYTYPPAETIAVLPGPEGKGAIVEICTYARPNPLQGLLTRLRRTLRI